MMPDLIRRQIAADKTMNKYRHKKFDWQTRSTCIHMAWFHMRAMGHTLPKLPEMRSLLAAHRGLARRGWDNVGDMMATLMPEIPHASMLLGDIAMLRSADSIGALVVNVGGKVIGWHDDARAMVVMEPLEIERAWRL